MSQVYIALKRLCYRSKPQVCATFHKVWNADHQKDGHYRHDNHQFSHTESVLFFFSKNHIQLSLSFNFPLLPITGEPPVPPGH
jgi:hypothetical protein